MVVAGHKGWVSPEMLPAGHALWGRAPSLPEPYHVWQHPDGQVWAAFHRWDEHYLLRFSLGASFLIHADGRKVQYTCAADLPADTLQHLHQHQVWPMALSLQGLQVLHGSALEIDGFAVGFLGQTGWGKSTLATSFACAGHRALTDDSIILTPEPPGWQVHPSPSGFRLWPDSQRALVPHLPAAAQQPHYTYKGRFVDDAQLAFCAEPRPLKALYLLDAQADADLSIAPLAPQQALIELLGHSFQMELQRAQALQQWFERLADLANLGLCHRLRYPRRFEMLPAVRQAIVSHARHLPPSLA